MKTYPLKSIDLNEAIKKQFKLVDEITRVYKGSEFLSLGDLGVVQPLNQPSYTKQAEKVIANFFDAEKALLVQGAGTAAIRFSLLAVFKANDTILIHDAPIYPTTKVSIESLALKVIKVDFNNLAKVKEALVNNKIDGCLVQYTRQLMSDSYDIGQVIATIKDFKDIPIITDDNYAALKVSKIGCELKADLSCFSCFKLQGPVGVGAIVGKEKFINKIKEMNYSGGSQVQGFQANEVLRAMVNAPVALAIQARVNEELLTRLNNGEISQVKRAYLANAQSKVLLVEFKEEIAQDVLAVCNELGAAINPVGAESKYEIAPMFYRLSSTFRTNNPELSKVMIRINPMRSGSDSVIRILKEAIERIGE